MFHNALGAYLAPNGALFTQKTQNKDKVPTLPLQSKFSDKQCCNKGRYPKRRVITTPLCIQMLPSIRIRNRANQCAHWSPSALLGGATTAVGHQGALFASFRTCSCHTLLQLAVIVSRNVAHGSQTFSECSSVPCANWSVPCQKIYSVMPGYCSEGRW